MPEGRLIPLLLRYRVRGIEAGRLVVDTFRGSVVGREFRGRGPRGLQRFPLEELQATPWKAVSRYVRLTSTEDTTRSWVGIHGLEALDVRS